VGALADVEHGFDGGKRVGRNGRKRYFRGRAQAAIAQASQPLHAQDYFALLGRQQQDCRQLEGHLVDSILEREFEKSHRQRSRTMKKVRIVFSPEAEQVYRYLNERAPESKIERSILNALNKKIELVKQNVHYGIPINKKLIPKEFKEKYGIKNMFRVELPDFWRMLYSLTNDDSKIEIIAFVLDISPHPEYDQKMGYQKR
jgi:hypothetical protein